MVGGDVMSWILKVDARTRGRIEPHSIYPSLDGGRGVGAQYYYDSYKKDGYLVELEESDRHIDEPVIFLRHVMPELPYSWAQMFLEILDKGVA
jgi:hypothetical protein